MNPVEAAVEWWLEWNDRCAAVADATVAVEALPALPELAEVERVLARAGLYVEIDPVTAAAVPSNTNHTPRGMAKTADDGQEQVSAHRVWALIGGRGAHGYAPEGARA
jgi:hypothetical protein